MQSSTLRKPGIRQAGLVLLIALGGTALSGCGPGKAGVSREQYDQLPEMTITSGLSAWQIFQRDENDRATICCQGMCATDGEVWAGVLPVVTSGLAVALEPGPQGHLAPRRVGNCDNGQWSATITNVPAGRWMVQLRIHDDHGRPVSRNALVEPVLVGDLWILAGQSNMQGAGDIAGADVEQPSPWVCTYSMNERWEQAEEPLHRLNESPDPVHHEDKSPEAIAKARQAPRGKKPDKGAGLGLPFAKELAARTRVPIGLVPCAHGATSMAQWDPARKDQGGNSLYGSMMRRFHAVGGRVKGVLWYQGESEHPPTVQPSYRQTFKQFITRVRQDFGDPRLPFYLVQISRYARLDPLDMSWSLVREDQRVIGREMPGVVTVAAIDLDLDDLIHIGTPGLKRLGRRLALVADHELFGNQAVTTGPRLVAVTTATGLLHTAVRVTFENVNGRLRPNEHIAGFSLRDAQGNPGPPFLDVKVDPQDPNTVICQLDVRTAKLPEGMFLWYGYGENPYCNLTDEQDMAVLAFGPIPVTPPEPRPGRE